jgi:hypothetical protein
MQAGHFNLFIDINLGKQPARAEPGAVDQQRQRRLGADERLKLRQLPIIGQIGWKWGYLYRMIPGQFGSKLLKAIFSPGDDDQIVAKRSQLVSEFAADPAGCASNQDAPTRFSQLRVDKSVLFMGSTPFEP